MQNRTYKRVLFTVCKLYFNKPEVMGYLVTHELSRGTMESDVEAEPAPRLLLPSLSAGMEVRTTPTGPDAPAKIPLLLPLPSVCLSVMLQRSHQH